MSNKTENCYVNHEVHRLCHYITEYLLFYRLVAAAPVQISPVFI